MGNWPYLEYGAKGVCLTKSAGLEKLVIVPEEGRLPKLLNPLN